MLFVCGISLGCQKSRYCITRSYNMKSIAINNGFGHLFCQMRKLIIIDHENVTIPAKHTFQKCWGVMVIVNPKNDIFNFSLVIPRIEFLNHLNTYRHRNVSKYYM